MADEVKDETHRLPLKGLNRNRIPVPDHSQLNAFENFYENFSQSSAEIH